MISRRKFLRRGSLWLPAALCFPNVIRAVPPLKNPAWLASATKPPAGGLSCAGCNSTTDSRFAGVSYPGDGTPQNYDNIWWSWQFTTATTKCITGVTWECTDGGTTRGATGEIYTDNAGSPGVIVGAGYTATIANLPDALSDVEFLFAATQTMAAGTYWVVTKVVASLSFGTHTNTAQGTEKFTVDSGANWNATNATFYSVFGVLGCDQA